MPEPRLPREAENQVVDLDVPRLILGLTILGSAAALVSLGIISAKSRIRLRHQKELLSGFERLLQMIKQLRTETTSNPESINKGGE